jgi:hypothetical protein
MVIRSSPPKPQLALVLTPIEPQYAAGSIPDFRAVLKNSGKTAVKLCTYMLKYRLLAAMNASDASGQDFALFPFVPAKYAPLKPADLKLVAPGQEITEDLKISGSEEWGFVKNGSLPPEVGRGFIARGFSAGAVTFATMLYGRMAIYTGTNNIYDGRWSGRTLPDDFPGADKLDLVGLFRGEVEGKARVVFK